MASETSMRRAVVEALRPLDAVAVENPAYPGTPDVNYVEGWVELKSLDRWPPRWRAVVVRHFTPEQRVWLRRRRAARGEATLLLRVGREWLLFDGEYAGRMLGTADELALRAMALRVWDSTKTMKEALCSVLSVLPRSRAASGFFSPVGVEASAATTRPVGSG